MRLSSTARYVIPALVEMAGRSDATHAAHRLAGAYGLRWHFVVPTFRRLLKVGIVYGVRARTGGYRLARPAKDITLLEVVQAVDGPIRADLPLTDSECDGQLRNQLLAACERAAEGRRRALAKVTVARLARVPT